MKIAIVGLGEVGRCFASAWLAKGADLLLCEPKPTTAALEIVARNGGPLHPDVGPWARAANAVVVCTTGAESKTVSIQYTGHLAPGSWLADFTTADPGDKRAASLVARERGIDYADVAIMGGIQLTGARTPLMACGDGAGRLAEFLTSMDAVIRVIDGQPGDAVSLKLLRSVFTKGLEALGVEVLVAAQQQGVREQLYDVLSDMDRSTLRDFLDMMVRTHVLHAVRRKHEVEQAGQQLARWGLPSRVLPGVQARFSATSAALRDHPPAQSNPTIDDALVWLASRSAPDSGRGDIE